MRNLWSVLTAILLGLSLVACGKDELPNPSDPNDPDNSGGSSDRGYSLSQMTGYWVHQPTWESCKLTIKAIEGIFSSQVPSSVLLEDDDLTSGVVGYYITNDGKAYDLYITVTTTRYSNNSVAGNKVLKTWYCTDGRTVYFMNILGSQNNSSCSVSGNELSIGRYKYTIKSTSLFTGNNAAYIKVNLSL